MAWKFLGTGWQTPLEFAGGRLRTASDEACVEQAIWAILETAPGERLMRPDFGCGIHDLVFAAPNPQLVGKIQERYGVAREEAQKQIDTFRAANKDIWPN